MYKIDKNTDSEGPLVFRFEAQLVRKPGAPATRSDISLDIPRAISQQLHDMTKVEGVLNGHPFRTALESDAIGSRWLQVSSSMLRGANAKIGDTVELAILGPEREIIPADLSAPLFASRKAKTLWEDLTPLGRLDWIRWINLAKNPETRARRITRTVEQLADGIRRPCCVNVNEFMLCRIEEDELKTLSNQ